MAEDLDTTADPFLQLLTDALRAGPGSPEWHQATTKLRRDGIEGNNEHAMLIAVREHLASGKDYRTVRAGPGFTRRLMERLDEEPVGQRRTLPLATLMAAVGAATLALFFVGLFVLMLRGGGGDATAELAGLRNSAFTQTISSASFDGEIPIGWTGDRAMFDASAGLRPAATRPAANLSMQVLADPVIAADGSAAFEVLLRPPTDPNTIVQIFVTDSAGAAESGQMPPGLLWVLQGGDGRVALPSGRLSGGASTFPTTPVGTLVRLVVGPRSAIISVGDRELFAAEHGLSDDANRRFGVRFLTRGGPGKDDGAILSARVLKP
ncbi:MAG TPA: hypothetical protein VGN72_17660 [Tepidisphaeraceae bacterium]|jgi:hypothetical protein|nr:hypothetical protein [Tepidisphaeraceae bacterium]